MNNCCRDLGNLTHVYKKNVKPKCVNIFRRVDDFENKICILCSVFSTISLINLICTTGKYIL